jgi:hypothetical protein
LEESLTELTPEAAVCNAMHVHAHTVFVVMTVLLPFLVLSHPA